MPPRSCLWTLPLRLADGPTSSLLPSRLQQFSTTSQHNARATKPTVHKRPTIVRRKKKGAPQKAAKPPEPGERKASRKRIVLSNTNAVPIATAKTLERKALQQRPDEGNPTANVYALPDPIIDQLRTIEAFKPKQGWAFFKRPAVLVGQEARRLHELQDEILKRVVSGEASEERIWPELGHGTTVRNVIYGEKSVGKSVLLLQAMAMAFQKKWIVINLPEARELTNSHTAYAPLVGKGGRVTYMQPKYTAKLLQQILDTNRAVLNDMDVKPGLESSFPVALREGMKLPELMQIGIAEPERAWHIFEAFWSTITSPNSAGGDTHESPGGDTPRSVAEDTSKSVGGDTPKTTGGDTPKSVGGDTPKTAGGEDKARRRPPILFCLDNLAHIMKESKYQMLDKGDDKLKPIHSHDLALVNLFISCLSGATQLPNGAMILAATSTSDAPKSVAMEVAIARLDARRRLALGLPQPAHPLFTSQYQRAQRLAPDAHPDPTHLSRFHSPFAPIDTRVLSALESVHLTRMGGVSQDEAAALMRYWALSGMLPDVVLERRVAEMRALSGGGVVGALELSAVRYLRRQAEQPRAETGGAKIRQH